MFICAGRHFQINADRSWGGLLFPETIKLSGGAFNLIPSTISKLVKRHANGNFPKCFPDPWETFDADKPSVTVGTFDEDVIYSEADLWRFLQAACVSYASLHPDEAEAVMNAASKNLSDRS